MSIEPSSETPLGAPSPTDPLIGDAVGVSRVFDQLCDGERGADLFALIAYALYRQEKQEWAKKQRRSPDDLDAYDETMTPSRLEGLKRRAEELLEDFAVNLIEDQKPLIQQELRLEEFGPFKAELLQQKAEMLQRIEQLNQETLRSVSMETHWSKSLIVNIAAFVITALLTTVVAVSLIVPQVAERATLEALRAERALPPEPQP